MTVMINETSTSFNVLPTVLTIATSPDIIPVTYMDIVTLPDSSIIMVTVISVQTQCTNVDLPIFACQLTSAS